MAPEHPFLLAQAVPVFMPITPDWPFPRVGVWGGPTSVDPSGTDGGLISIRRMTSGEPTLTLPPGALLSSPPSTFLGDPPAPQAHAGGAQGAAGCHARGHSPYQQCHTAAAALCGGPGCDIQLSFPVPFLPQCGE